MLQTIPFLGCEMSTDWVGSIMSPMKLLFISSHQLHCCSGRRASQGTPPWGMVPLAHSAELAVTHPEDVAGLCCKQWKCLLSSGGPRRADPRTLGQISALNIVGNAPFVCSCRCSAIRSDPVLHGKVVQWEYTMYKLVHHSYRNSLFSMTSSSLGKAPEENDWLGLRGPILA